MPLGWRQLASVTQRIVRTATSAFSRPTSLRRAWAAPPTWSRPTPVECFQAWSWLPLRLPRGSLPSLHDLPTHTRRARGGSLPIRFVFAGWLDLVEHVVGKPTQLDHGTVNGIQRRIELLLNCLQLFVERRLLRLG